jgi:hypothetical protein
VPGSGRGCGRCETDRSVDCSRVMSSPQTLSTIVASKLWARLDCAQHKTRRRICGERYSEDGGVFAKGLNVWVCRPRTGAGVLKNRAPNGTMGSSRRHWYPLSRRLRFSTAELPCAQQQCRLLLVQFTKFLLRNWISYQELDSVAPRKAAQFDLQDQSIVCIAEVPFSSFG